MKKLLIVLFLLNLVSCKKQSNDKDIPFKCMRTERYSVYRCENEEIICYTFQTDAMQCKFKK